MKKLSSDEIRDIWLNFFKEKGHYIEPSASLIPNNDPTLLWINAGVAALKKYFDGTLTPKHKRITNAQKCIRTNDIDNVGYTSRHHTFFEMLGDFSIGDYFRNEVIPWAFELLTSEKYYGLDKDKLYITYYPDDKETYNLWTSLGIRKENMVASSSNFWEIGEGPCGPDTEINYDRGEKYDPEHLGLKLLEEDLDNDRYIELWNIVFSQFNSEPGKKRSEYKLLPQKNIDTGAGLERFACIMQDVETNFDTDLFLPYIKEIEKKANQKYEGKAKLAYRVISDHIRSLTFALADGAMFSNEGRGYVLKRLLRRASRYAQTLGLQTGDLAKLVPVVCSNMSHFYPYLKEKEEKISKMILQEEEKFSFTLKTGEKLLSTYLEKNPNLLSAEDAFKLSDTYGFPFELSKEIAGEKGAKVDEEGYKVLLEKSKELARNSRKDEQSFALQEKDLLEFITPSTFTYEDEIIEGKVIGLFKDGKRVASLDSTGDIAFDKTNFYAEMGGEVADTGYLKNNNCEATVTMVKKANHGQHLLHVNVLYGEIKEGDILKEIPDFKNRDLVRKNHSATHLLQKALQDILGDDIHQEGAYYDDKLLRLDFNYPTKLSDDQLIEIEEEVNKKIMEALPVKTKVMSKEEALKLNAMHLFNEKYADRVRVVSIGDYSIEFCGGLHVSNSKDIQLFTIESEQAISSGVRRIVAYTSIYAYQYLKEKENVLNSIANLLKLNSTKGVKEKVKELLNTNDSNKKTIKSLEEKIANSKLDSIKSNIVEINGYSFLAMKLNDLTHQQEESIVSNLINTDKKLVLFFAVNQSSRYDLVVAKSKSANSLSAGKLMREISTILEGKGGGKDDIAFGGCSSISNFDKAVLKIKEYLK